VSFAVHRDGTLYIVDSSANVVYRLTGPFTADEAFAALDTVGMSANTTEVDTLDLFGGALSRWSPA